MVQWSETKAFALLILLVISAFASSSETAFFSLNRFQLRRVKDRYRAAYDRIRKLLSKPTRLLVLILVINEVVNITITTLITELLQSKAHLLPNMRPQTAWMVSTLLSMAVSLPILLLAVDITPKVIAARMNKFVAMMNSGPLILLYRVLFPVLWIVDTFVTFALKRFKSQGKDPLSRSMSMLSEEDFVILMEEGHEEGTVNPDEKKLITNVLELDDSHVSEVMTPINQAFCLPGTSRIEEVLPDIRAQKYSRIPVYQKNRKKIIGVLYLKDLLSLHKHPQLRALEVKSLVSTPMFVTGEMRLSALFRRFKENKTHMAIVVDKAEEALGVVTMEDVLESIFGEIEDERDVR